MFLNLFDCFQIRVYCRKKGAYTKKWSNRILTICHIIISCVRPRSFISAILVGPPSMMYKKYASKSLINALSFLGLCSSYDGAERFENFLINNPVELQINDAYVQFVFDNADHNMITLVGYLSLDGRTYVRHWCR